MYSLIYSGIVDMNILSTKTAQMTLSVQLRIWNNKEIFHNFFALFFAVLSPWAPSWSGRFGTTVETPFGTTAYPSFSCVSAFT
jgi:hypothetical protein